MEAFRSFDWDHDERWRAYLQRIELPGGDSGLLKAKARWFKREIDPDFDVAAATGASQPATAASTGPSRPPPASGPTSTSGGAAGGYTSQQARGPPPAPPPRYGQYGSTGSGTYGNAQAQLRLGLMHLFQLGLGIWAVLPLLPYGGAAYTYFLRLVIITYGYKIYLQHGLPSFRPMSMAWAWVQRIIPTADFVGLLTALSFSAQPRMVLVAAPPLLLAAYHVAAYAAAQFPGHPLWRQYGARVHAIMLRQQPQALHLIAGAEIATAAMLLLQLLTPARSLLTCVFYTQTLKLKYHMPDSAPHHRQVWSQVDLVTRPYRARLPAAVEGAIQAAARWFSAVPGAP